MVPLNIIHLIGVALGLGVATGLNLFLINLIARNTNFKANQFSELKNLSTIVVIGLLLLWISGLGFLIEYQLFEHKKLFNTKLQAKIIIVIFLSLNGLFIHYFFLNQLKRSIGKPIFTQLSTESPSLIFISCAISLASWYAAFICGAIPLLNNMYTFQQFMACYFLAILFFSICALLFFRILHFKYRPSTKSNSRPVLRL